MAKDIVGEDTKRIWQGTDRDLIEWLPSSDDGVSMSRFRRLVDECVRLGRFDDIPAPEGLHLAVSMTHRLVATIVRLEAEGCGRLRLIDGLSPARDVHASSPFIKRLQEWPRGYAGDFETVEYIVQQRNLARPGHLSFFLEEYALGSPIAQQHRNKVDLQARAVASVVARCGHTDGPRLLSIAAGGSPALRQVQDLVASRPAAITLLDQDPDALAFSAANLPLLRHRLSLVCANVVRGLSRASQYGPYDLVLAGGLFDYLPDRVAVTLLRCVRQRLLADAGTLFFTNISRGNPYQPWIEYLGNWFLQHRTADELRGLCQQAGFGPAAVEVDTDRTGLALVVTCRR